MTLQEYIASLRGRTVAVIGIGVSNTPLLRLLLREGIAVTACDRSDRAKLGALAEELEAAGAVLRLGDGYLQGLDQDVIFRTPGLRPDVPELEAARAKGSTITSEMEVFFEVCPCPIIAVTGSDGKTTTTTIIAQLLRAAGHTVHVGGNIGHPLLAEADTIRPTDWAVLELSSAILGRDGCLNFFAGPTNSQFKAEFNWYNVHYLYTHVVGTSGGNTSDMKEAIEMMTSGKINPAAMITHIGGLNAVVDTVLNLPKIPGGKKLIYTQIELPLTAIADFGKLGETDPLFAKLDEITKRHNGLWSPEAEKYLLANK